MNGFDSQAVVESFTQWLGTELDLEPCNGVQEGKIIYCRAKGKAKPNRDGRARMYLNGRPAGWAQNHYNGSGVRTWTRTKRSPRRRLSSPPLRARRARPC